MDACRPAAGRILKVGVPEVQMISNTHSDIEKHTTCQNMGSMSEYPIYLLVRYRIRSGPCHQTQSVQRSYGYRKLITLSMCVIDIENCFDLGFDSGFCMYILVRDRICSNAYYQQPCMCSYHNSQASHRKVSLADPVPCINPPSPLNL
jgi:hypothetical protein